jgi:hypothetical protein
MKPLVLSFFLKIYLESRQNSTHSFANYRKPTGYLRDTILPNLFGQYELPPAKDTFR